jgi:4-alpha-glucanotransferase
MEALVALADLYGVQTSYYEVSGQLRTATPEALLFVLRVLGAPLEKQEQAADALRSRRQELSRRVLEPVNVAWDGTLPAARLRIPTDQVDALAEFTVRLENGESKSWSQRIADLPERSQDSIEGVTYSVREMGLPFSPPLGAHSLHLQAGSLDSASRLLSAPVRAPEPRHGKTWGIFVPLYAVHSESSWGGGDFKDLENLTDWVTERGGGLVATLPLLAAFLDEPFEPGPYAPASRLFWNEFYIDVAGIPEFRQSPAAQQLVSSPEFQDEIRALRGEPLVDYRRQMLLKRRVLEELARSLSSQPSQQRAAFEAYVTARPKLADYAAFRAVMERQHSGWPAWPAPLRDGHISADDFDPAVQRYHMYVQWVADEQLHALATKARASGPGFYLDLPLGVHQDSYDVWRERNSFALGCSAGAPPDPFFSKGQDWGFPPLHPERIRQDGYRYVASYIRHHLGLAGVLRIDHMMGLHRLYWVPQGLGAKQGVYVRYPAEELYAVYCLETARHGAVLVGEDLGTVPPDVRPAMEHHNVHRMYVMQYELQPHNHNALNVVYPGCVASLNTHDMPTFAAFWQALDVDDRIALGVLDPGQAEGERGHRRWLTEALIRSLRIEGLLHEDTGLLALLRGCLQHMSIGSPSVVLANLEDLWLATDPQNVPGTWHERPNWRRRARLSLEQIKSDGQILETVEQLNRAIRS